MTNEQTAFLLRQIAWRLRTLAKYVDENIETGQRELVRIWVGEGEEPPPFSMERLGLNAKNWAWANKGQFTATQAVADFAEEMDMEADKLRPPKAKGQ